MNVKWTAEKRLSAISKLSYVAYQELELDYYILIGMFSDSTCTDDVIDDHINSPDYEHLCLTKILADNIQCFDEPA